METYTSTLDLPTWTAGAGPRDEQLKVLLESFSEAVEGGSPRPVVQRVLSDLVVSLKIARQTDQFDPDDDVIDNLETFELDYASGHVSGARRLLEQLHVWWEERALVQV
jgi:hypothetical protein